MSNKEIVKCVMGDGEWEGYPSSRPRFCTLSCAGRAFRSDRICVAVCERCGHPFEVARSVAKPRWCSRGCYDEQREDDSEWAPARFRLKVDSSSVDGCWPWTGAHDSAGYGTYGGTRKRHRGLSHRRAWEIVTGNEIPPGMMIGHTCDNAGCVRYKPEGIYEIGGKAFPRRGHLWLGTDADNMLDKTLKGRNRNHVGAAYPRVQTGELSFAMVAGVPVAIWTLHQSRVQPDGSTVSLD